MSISLMTRVWKLTIPSTAKFVLLSLADQANDDSVCWPSQPQIAARCSLSDRAVREQIVWLEAKGIIKRTVRAGIGTTFTITIQESDEPRNDVPPQNSVPPRNDVPPTPEQYSGDPGTTFRQIISNHQEPPIYISRFEEFWSAYPKKVGKKKTQEIWKSKKLDSLADSILSGLSEYKTVCKPGFILDPERFLKNERWADEYHAVPINVHNPFEGAL